MKTKTGAREWAAANVNIQRGCSNGCRYCYARHNAVVRFHQCTKEQWLNPVIDNDKVDKSYKKREGVVMFPSSHDITLKNLSQYLCVLHKLIDAGNHVLIVSKPRWQCISVICETFREFKSQILFRFTIGSTSDEVLGFWEPNAPKFEERLSCLKYANQCNYQTSVSCEPYLDPYVPYLYATVVPYLTDSFWIGLLRDFDNRVDLSDVTKEQMEKYINPLKAIQSELFVKSLYKILNKEPFVIWKDSIWKVINGAQLYKYIWGNNKNAVESRFRLQFKNRKCRVLVRGKMNSCLVEFVDNGEQLNCSRNALRKVDG